MFYEVGSTEFHRTWACSPHFASMCRKSFPHIELQKFMFHMYLIIYPLIMSSPKFLHIIFYILTTKFTYQSKNAFHFEGNLTCNCRNKELMVNISLYHGYLNTVILVSLEELRCADGDNLLMITYHKPP